jgi:transcriptional regulator with XRE-family HTH domain
MRYQLSIYDTAFINNMRHLRQASGLSQDDLSEILGIKRGRLGAWEEKRCAVPVEYMMKVCVVFKVQLVDMLTTCLKTKIQLKEVPKSVLIKKRNPAFKYFSID